MIKRRAQWQHMLIAGTVCAGVFCAVMVTHSNANPSGDAAASSLDRRAIPAVRQTSRIPSIARGITRPKSIARVTTGLEGQLTSVDVTEGDHVKAGDRLGLIDDRVARQSVAVAESRAEARGSIAQAEAELGRAKLTLARTQEVFNRSSSNPHELDLARSAVLRAEADLLSATEAREVLRAQLAFEEMILDTHSIPAPFDGVVIDVTAGVGETLTNTTPFVTIASLSTLIADVHVPLELFGSMAEGDAFEFRAGTPVLRTIRGTVQSIDPTIDSASRTFRCVFSFDNADEALPSGFTVELISENDVTASAGDQL